jgi:hypothetical protein
MARRLLEFRFDVAHHHRVSSLSEKAQRGALTPAEHKLDRRVRRRAKGLCEYCRSPRAFDPWAFHTDHIIAAQHGGEPKFNNLALACSRCNRNKGPNIAGLDIITREITRLYSHGWEGPRHRNSDDRRATREALYMAITPPTASHRRSVDFSGRALLMTDEEILARASEIASRSARSTP